MSGSLKLNPTYQADNKDDGLYPPAKMTKDTNSEKRTVVYYDYELENSWLDIFYKAVGTKPVSVDFNEGDVVIVPPPPLPSTIIIK